MPQYWSQRSYIDNVNPCIKFHASPIALVRYNSDHYVRPAGLW